MMNLRDQISEETAAMIENGVKESGLAIDSYLIRLMCGDAEELRPLYKTATPQELVDAFKKWAESNESTVPGNSI